MKATLEISRNPADGRWSWVLLAGNGEPLAQSTKSFERRGNCVRSIRKVAAAASIATVKEKRDGEK